MNNYRHEYKYIINAMQENIFIIRLGGGILDKDEHIGEDGSYEIKSLYFDDYHNQCFYENEHGIDLRAKYRIRYYNDDTSLLKLEKKMKINGMTQKESCLITKSQCETFVEGKIPDIEENMDDLKKALFTEMRLKNLVPKAIVSYKRTAFVYPVGNVRITFDKAISSSNHIDAFLSESIPARLVLPQGMSVLEVKWDEGMPLYIKKILGMDGMQWTSFSKYYLCRKYGLNGGMNR